MKKTDILRHNILLDLDNNKSIDFKINETEIKTGKYINLLEIQNQIYDKIIKKYKIKLNNYINDKDNLKKEIVDIKIDNELLLNDKDKLKETIKKLKLENNICFNENFKLKSLNNLLNIENNNLKSLNNSLSLDNIRSI